MINSYKNTYRRIIKQALIHVNKKDEIALWKMQHDIKPDKNKAIKADLQRHTNWCLEVM